MGSGRKPRYWITFRVNQEKKSMIPFRWSLLWLGAAIFLASCSPATVENSAENSVETPTPEPTAVAEPTKISASGKVGYTVFLPTDDGKLRPKKFEVELSKAQRAAMGQTKAQYAKKALETLFETEKDYFARGIKVRRVWDNGGYYTADLSKEILQSPAWSGASDSVVAFDALVLTLASGKEILKDSEKSEVKIYIEGKPASLFGELDASGPIDPAEMQDLVAKK